MKVLSYGSKGNVRKASFNNVTYNQDKRLSND